MSGGAERVLLGRIHGLFGIKGGVKVYSYTVPPANILDYPRWQIGRGGDWRVMRLVDGRVHGKGLVAYLAPEDGEPIADRDQAASLLQADIAVNREELPPPPAGEYYWADLIGLTVANLDDQDLGRVTGLMETGANDVLVVAGERERLIPFVHGPVIRQVDLTAGRIIVDWHPDD